MYTVGRTANNVGMPHPLKRTLLDIDDDTPVPSKRRARNIAGAGAGWEGCFAYSYKPSFTALGFGYAEVKDAVMVLESGGQRWYGGRKGTNKANVTKRLEVATLGKFSMDKGPELSNVGMISLVDDAGETLPVYQKGNKLEVFLFPKAFAYKYHFVGQNLEWWDAKHRCNFKTSRMYRWGPNVFERHVRGSGVDYSPHRMQAYYQLCVDQYVGTMECSFGVEPAIWEGSPDGTPFYVDADGSHAGTPPAERVIDLSTLTDTVPRTGVFHTVFSKIFANKVAYTGAFPVLPQHVRFYDTVDSSVAKGNIYVTKGGLRVCANFLCRAVFTGGHVYVSDEENRATLRMEIRIPALSRVAHENIQKLDIKFETRPGKDYYCVIPKGGTASVELQTNAYSLSSYAYT